MELVQRIDVCINNAGINKINPIYDLTARRLRPHHSSQPARPDPDLPIGEQEDAGIRIRPDRQHLVHLEHGHEGGTGPLRYDENRTDRVDQNGSCGHGPYNVLVNAVSPGVTRTELTDSILSPRDAEELAAQIPLNRFAQPTEISKVIMFLASDLNTYLTGQNITVDGGFTVV